MTGLRDYILLAVVGGLVPVSLMRPWIGVLGWFWIAYMVPHALTWGFGRTLPLAAIVGGATLAGFLFMGPGFGLGFFGVEGGILGLADGGGSWPFGPEKSFFEDNNTFGLALAM